MRRNTAQVYLVLSILFFSFSNLYAKEIRVVSYNVLNLFDSKHDEGKKDYQFLPFNHPLKKEGCATISSSYYRKQCFETNWTKKKFLMKVKQMAKAIRSTGKKLPDIIGLSEVENDVAVKALADELGYEDYITTNGPDRRGIEVAILYNSKKLKFLEMEKILVTSRTRNILRAHFRVLDAPKKTILGVYVNHWPSLGNPTKRRIEAAKKLKASVNKQMRRFKKGYHVVALGDFNTPDYEEPNAIGMMTNSLWKNHLEDVQELADRCFEKKRAEPTASYWYISKNLWQKLDRILVSQNLLDGRSLEADIESFRIHAPDFMLTDVELKNGDIAYDVPFRYNFKVTTPRWAGYSDHLPILVDLSY